MDGKENRERRREKERREMVLDAREACRVWAICRYVLIEKRGFFFILIFNFMF